MQDDDGGDDDDCDNYDYFYTAGGISTMAS